MSYRPLGPALDRLRQVLFAWLKRDDLVDQGVAAIAATAEAVTIAELVDDLAQVKADMRALEVRTAHAIGALTNQLDAAKELTRVLAGRQDQLAMRLVSLDHIARMRAERPH